MHKSLKEFTDLDGKKLDHKDFDGGNKDFFLNLVGTVSEKNPIISVE